MDNQVVKSHMEQWRITYREILQEYEFIYGGLASHIVQYIEESITQYHEGK
jgi:hypothetical protein